MEINIEYPTIKMSSEGNNITYINNFYQKLAESYSSYCEKRANRINISSFITERSRYMGGVLKYIISHNNSDYLSIVCEASFFDGYFKTLSRITQTWRLQDGILLPCTYFIKKEGLTPQKVKKKVGDMITEKIKSNKPEFTYTDTSFKKYAYNVNPNNFFLCSNGLAFWFEPGTLAPHSEGFPTFVIPYKKEESHQEGSS